ncbi:MAG: CehA/McbA family metallohydrolase [Myxococcota bacterium]
MCALRLRSILATSLALILATACGQEPIGGDPDAPAAPDADARPGPPGARWDVVESLRETADLAHDPSDGGGRAWLERDPDQAEAATVATPDRFRFVFEVGPLGIASGGTIHFQVSPFWEWSDPQTRAPERPGYTTVRADADDVVLEAEQIDQQLLEIRVTGRALAAGERLTLVYGAGEAGAYPDLYAERDSPFWFAVDGDGDGTRRFIPEPARIDVRSGPAMQLLATLPTVARPGEAFRVTLALLDAFGNTDVADHGAIALEVPEGLELAREASVAAGAGGRVTLLGTAREPGVYRLRARFGEIEAESNPMLVAAEGPRVLWGDLHGHTNYADGTGVPEDYFVYARDVSALDVAAITEHDHWGVLPLVSHPPYWDEIRRQTLRFHEPGRFVTLLGFEWTNWIHGHRHVLYFSDDGRPIDSVDEATDSPQELWSALEGQDALTFAHHSAGGPVPTNWEIPPDPRFEPLTEVASVHGHSEAPDAPGYIYSPVRGNSVRDALDRGYRLGFVGSGDSHDGHPGSDRRTGARGGLAAILAEEPTRASVLDALRRRRTYATNGPRILLRFALGSDGMGSVRRVDADAPVDDVMFVQVVAAAPLDRVELVRSGALVDGVLVEGRLEVSLHREVKELRPGEYLYVRAIQQDGGIAWSSPIWIEAADTGAPAEEP